MLTLKQKLFVKKYLQWGNATQAALAIYNTKSKKSAAVMGSKLLRNANINTYINSYVEPEESVVMYAVEMLKDVLEHGTWNEKVKALQIAFKLHGIL